MSKRTAADATIVDAIARRAEALHNFLTAQALAGWRIDPPIKVTAADLELERSIRLALSTLDRLRHMNRQNPVEVDRWISMQGELDRVYRTMLEAVG